MKPLSPQNKTIVLSQNQNIQKQKPFKKMPNIHIRKITKTNTQKIKREQLFEQDIGPLKRSLSAKSRRFSRISEIALVTNCFWAKTCYKKRVNVSYNCHCVCYVLIFVFTFLLYLILCCYFVHPQLFILFCSVFLFSFCFVSFVLYLFHISFLLFSISNGFLILIQYLLKF